LRVTERAHHRDTEVTEEAQREGEIKDTTGKLAGARRC
jgi:hypothetical protein